MKLDAFLSAILSTVPLFLTTPVFDDAFHDLSDWDTSKIIPYTTHLPSALPFFLRPLGHWPTIMELVRIQDSAKRYRRAALRAAEKDRHCPRVVWWGPK